MIDFQRPEAAFIISKQKCVFHFTVWDLSVIRSKAEKLVNVNVLRSLICKSTLIFNIILSKDISIDSLAL